MDENAALAEFARFGLGQPLSVSSAHQRGIPELLQAIVKLVPAESDATLIATDPNRMRIAFVGRPNVGKSTLVNRLLGEERMIASDVPGTTRDSIAADLERDGRLYTLIDTAGIRQRGKVQDTVEKFSVIKTLQSIEASQVVVLMLDASEGVTEQDATVLGHILDSGRAFVIVVNKWDGQSTYQREQTMATLDRKLSFVVWAERITISAKHGSGLRELFRAIHRAHASATRSFSTAEVTKAVEIAYESFPPPAVRGHVSKMRYAHPGGENPPTFIIHGSRLKSLPDSYKRYLENFFRKRFKLVGTPVRFEFREGENPYAGRKNVLTEGQQRSRQRMIRNAKKR
jgi:GTP-binding protein